MIAYFRRQNNLFMILGAVGVLLLLTPFYRQWLLKQEFYMKAFYVALPAFLGVIAGRVCASLWANGRLRQIDEILYGKGEPETFIRVFEPLVKRAPANTIEYVNGRVKLAYAYEAMGLFDKSLEELCGVKPEGLQLHGLAAMALVANQRARTYLLMGDTGKAGACLQELKELQKTAERRALALAANLKECVRLAQVWLEFLLGEGCDEDYIAEEMELARHEIHRSEMGLLLARMRMYKGDEAAAKTLLVSLARSGDRLYAAREARRQLGLLSEAGYEER